MMGRILIACVLAAVMVTSREGSATTMAQGRDLNALTAGADVLPPGCALSPARAVISGGTLHGGLWAGLPIPTNPWIGSDPVVIGFLKERTATVEMPDGPPPDASGAARFRAQLADGVDEAYAAVYLREGSRGVITVVAFVMRAAEENTDAARPPGRGSAWFQVSNGPLTAFVSGGATECGDALRRHVANVVDR